MDDNDGNDGNDDYHDHERGDDEINIDNNGYGYHNKKVSVKIDK